MNWKSPGLLRLMKSGEGGVVETSWMFQAASPASIHPARSPTRGSGLGAAVEKGRWDGAHAATDNATIANQDRKSTRLNSSHSQISYAVFCLKKKKNNKQLQRERQPWCRARL